MRQSERNYNERQLLNVKVLVLHFVVDWDCCGAGRRSWVIRSIIYCVILTRVF